MTFLAQVDYPFKPPSLLMVTPSGRFETGVRLCLSMSDFHPETWWEPEPLPLILTKNEKPTVRATVGRLLFEAHPARAIN